MIKLLIVVSFVLSRVVCQEELASPEDLRRFKTAEWVNEDEVAAQVGFFNYSANPYPKGKKGYNTDIDFNQNCWVKFENKEKTQYSMLSSVNAPHGPHGVFKSQVGPCGVCSGLQDLALYIEMPDLKTPVRKCGVRNPTKSGNVKCLKNLGFSDRCAYIWYYNTAYTKKRCFYTCIRHFFTPNIVPRGVHNPCRPAIEYDNGMNLEDDDDINYYSEDKRAELEREAKEFEELPMKASGAIPPPKKKTSSDPVRPDVSKKKTFTSSFKDTMSLSKISATFSSRRLKNQKGCLNTINKEPACDEFQWKNGPHRLNACLQCDECASGPIFKKVAGRTRRWSGIKSGIDRPGVPTIDHHYFSNDLIKQEI